MSSAIVVGAGPNGLAAAVRLAQHGVDVTVLEASDHIGGGTSTSELTLPGVLHDHCSAFHPMGVGSPYLARLGLERYGLRWRWPEIDCAHPLDSGEAGLLWRSVDETASGLGPDGDRWRQTFERSAKDFDDARRRPHASHRARARASDPARRASGRERCCPRRSPLAGGTPTRRGLCSAVSRPMPSSRSTVRCLQRSEGPSSRRATVTVGRSRRAARGPSPTRSRCSSRSWAARSTPAR